jgi:hypothetical protein
MGLKVALVAVAAVVTLAVAIAWVAQQRWRADTRAWQQRLLAASRVTAGGGVTAAQYAGLPAPVAHYLGRALPDGQAMPRHVRVTWAGEFNLGQPGADRWVPFTAEQDFIPGAPGFVWDARMKIAPGIVVNVRDAFLGGRGAMLGRVFGLVTVVDRQGDGDFAAAALQRYLGETIWLPTALLPGQGVQWEALDAQRARATIRSDAVTTSLEFRFGADGMVASVHAARRSFDDGKHPPRLLPWQARVLRHGPIGGVQVPIEATVEWLFPEGAWAYWRGRPVAIVHDPRQSD